MTLFQNRASKLSQDATGTASTRVLLFDAPKSEPNLRGATLYPQEQNERKPKLVTQSSQLLGKISPVG